MANINCEECGKAINNNSSICPNCGFPLPKKKELPHDYYDFKTIKSDTIENALKQASQMLNEVLEDLEYEIVDYGKKSFFIKKDAIIRVRRKEK